MNLLDKTIIAIDPGVNGAIAIYHQRVNHTDVFNMPETPTDVYDLLATYSNNAVCFLEKVQGLPGMGGSPMFNFGKGYGHLEMALIALSIPTETILPQKWTKTMSLGTKSSCSSSTEWKNKLKAKAQQLYPNIKVTLHNADALLILHYALSIHGNSN